MNVYHYIYYRFYRLLEHSDLPWWSDLKAAAFIATIEVSLIAILNYKISVWLSIPDATIFGKWGYGLIIVAPPFIFNYYLFQYRDMWKEIISYFDEADRQEKNKMNLQMAVVFLLVVGLFAFLLLL